MQIFHHLCKFPSKIKRLSTIFTHNFGEKSKEFLIFGLQSILPHSTFLDNKHQHKETRINISSKQIEKKIVETKRLLQTQPNNIEKLQQLGHHYLQAKMFSEASEIFIKLIKNHKKQQYYNNLAFCYFQLGDKLEAIRYLQSGLQIDKNNYQILQNLAFIYVQVQDYHKAAQKLYEASQLSQNQNQLFKQIAKKFIDEESYTQALYYQMNQFLTQNNQNSSQNLNKLFLHTQKIQQAKQFYSFFVSIPKYRFVSNFSMGTLLFQAGKSQEAQEYLIKTHNLNQNIYQVNLYLASINFQKNQLQTSQIYFKNCINLKPQLPTPYVSLGFIFLRQNKHMQAKKSLEKSIQLNKQQSLSYYGIGIIAVQNQNFEQGIDFLKKAVEIDQSNYAALQYLSNCLFLLGKQKQANQYLSKAKQIQSSLIIQNQQGVQKSTQIPK